MPDKKSKRKIRAGKPKENKIGGKEINPNATNASFGEDTDLQYPVFSFKYSHSSYPLHDWGKRELKGLMKYLKMMESLTWKRIKTDGRDGSLRFTSINQRDFPKEIPSSLNISPDETLIEITVGDPCRLFGFRTGRIFNVIWFDKNHNVYDMS